MLIVMTVKKTKIRKIDEKIIICLGPQFNYAILKLKDDYVSKLVFVL